MNESKSRHDSPMWAKWRASRAIGTIDSARLKSEIEHLESDPTAFRADSSYSSSKIHSEPISQETRQAILNEIKKITKKGYKSTNLGIRVISLPSLHGSDGEIQRGRVSLVLATRVGMSDPHASAILHGHNEPREFIHVIDPKTASPWLMHLPLATEGFGKRVLQEIRVNSTR